MNVTDDRRTDDDMNMSSRSLKTDLILKFLVIVWEVWVNSKLLCKCFVCTETGRTMATGDIWFRFKEGYLNAVRKTVRIQDLMSWTVVLWLNLHSRSCKHIVYHCHEVCRCHWLSSRNLFILL